jgi:hypothetical protein
MKLWTLSTVAVALFLAYSVTQYWRESAALHQEATASERVPSSPNRMKARKPIDRSCLCSELAMRKHLTDEGRFSHASVGVTAAIR